MIKVDLITDVFSPSGYSAHARELIDCIHERVDLRLVDHKHDSATISMPAEKQALYGHMLTKSRKPDVVIQFETPEFFRPQEGPFNIGFTQWESTRIPNTDLDGSETKNWVKQMNRMDMMWTSCNLAKKAFEDTGVKVPVEVIHGPVNTDFYRPGREELEITGVNVGADGFIPKDKRLPVIGCIAQWTQRKNLTEMLVSLLSYFRRSDFVVLLKTYGPAMTAEHNQHVLKQVQAIRGMIKNPDAPEVVLVMDNLTDEQVAQLYASMDIYVNPSRGEGFCMPLVQAMSSGVTPVSNGFSAPADYITQYQNGFLVDYTLEPAVQMHRNPWYRFDQEWGRISIQDLGTCVRYALQAKGQHSKAARDTIVKRMSYPVVADRIMGILNGVMSNATTS